MYESNLLVLKNTNLEVVFNQSTGLPEFIKLYSTDGFFDGADIHECIEARVCRLLPRSYTNTQAVLKSVRKGMSCLSFYFEVFFEEAPAAAFELRYLLESSSIKLTLEDVREYEGFEFIEANIPCIAAISDSNHEEAWLAHCQSAGHLVSLKDAKPGELPEHPYFGKIMHMLPVVMLGTSDAVCVMEVTAFNDGMLLKVEQDGHKKRASIGTVKTYRVDGSGWCNSNDENLARVYANDKTPNLIVGQKSSCRVDFAGDYDRNGRVDWLDGAKIVHERMPKSR